MKVTKRSRKIEHLYDFTNLLENWEFYYNQVSPGKVSYKIDEVVIDNITICKEYSNVSFFQVGKCNSETFNIGFLDGVKNTALHMGNTISKREIITLPPNTNSFFLLPQDVIFYFISIPKNLLDKENFDKYIKYNLFLNVEKNEFLYSNFLELAELVFSDHQDFNSIKEKIMYLIEIYFSHLESYKFRENFAGRKAKMIIENTLDHLIYSEKKSYSIQELCTLNNTTKRTLYNCFNQFTGESPSAFIKYIKLNQIKNDLTSNKIHKCISQLAFDWGFSHISNFSQDYKFLFSESPSKQKKNNLD